MMKRRIGFWSLVLKGMWLAAGNPCPDQAPRLTEVIDNIEVNAAYKAYTTVAVNNSHMAAYDDAERLHVVHVDTAESLVVRTRQLDGSYLSQDLLPHESGAFIRNPSIAFKAGKLYVAWIERLDDANHIELAMATPEDMPPYSWTRTHVATLAYAGAENEAKYLTLALPEGEATALIGLTEGSPDVYARIFNVHGELDISPLDSGYPTWEKSSDLTLAAEGQTAIVMWEEKWSGFGPGQESYLVFSISQDGGQTWSAASNVLVDGPTLGGDPSICISGGYAYAVWQRTMFGGSGVIYAARMKPGMDQFELLDIYATAERGTIGEGWLPCLDCRFDRIAVSWEYTQGAYFDKGEHSLGTALILHADQAPLIAHSAISDTPVDDDNQYDAAANIRLQPDGQSTDVFWQHVTLLGVNQANLALHHRVDAISPPPISRGTGLFNLGAQELGNTGSFALVGADFNNDGSIDILEANNLSDTNKIWHNNGRGVFSDSGQSLGSYNTHAMVAGDLDGDGDLDLVEGNNSQMNLVYFNDGNGVFTDSGQALGPNSTWALALGDFDGDGDLDLAEGNSGDPDQIWHNNGSGFFEAGPLLSLNTETHALACTDLNGDGALDLVTGVIGAGNEIFLNDGSGNFTLFGAPLGLADTSSVALGDIDGNGTMDLVAGNHGGAATTIWLNDGAAGFSEHQALTPAETGHVALFDLDGDGDLDLIEGNGLGQPDRIWFNDGDGNFTDSGQNLGSYATKALLLSDFDGDGDADIFTAHFHEPNRIYFNQNTCYTFEGAEAWLDPSRSFCGHPAPTVNHLVQYISAGFQCP